MRIAHIENGVVTNVSIAPDDFELPDDGATVASEAAAIGDLYQNGEFARATISFSPTPIKNECGRRIFVVVNDSAQRNTAAAAAAGWPGEADADAAQAAFVAGVEWIGAMRAACGALIAAQDMTFNSDAHWPPAPASVVALAARY